MPYWIVLRNNGVRVMLVEDASRFARDLVAQELGVLCMVRQIAGNFAQCEKNRLVKKLREARERHGGRSRALPALESERMGTAIDARLPPPGH